MLVERLEHVGAVAPPVGGIVGRARPLGPLARDLVPADGEAHELDAEPVEPVDPLLERSRAEDQPGVVVDPEASGARGLSRRREGAGDEAAEDGEGGASAATLAVSCFRSVKTR